MKLALLIIIGLMLFAGLVYGVFNAPELRKPEGIDDAMKADRCAEFRQTDEEDRDVYFLGYGDRIRQFFHGCL